MASPSPEESPPRKGVDDWTMVNRVSELIENGGMSDISLPPLPASESTSEDDDSSSGEEVSVDHVQRHSRGQSQSAEWTPSESAEQDASDEDGGESKERGRRGGGGGGRSGPGIRRRNSGDSSRRRLPSARSRGTRSSVVATSSSPSVSPTARPRRRSARSERNGRRHDEKPPSLLSSSACSSCDSFSSPCASPSPPNSPPGVRGGSSSARRSGTTTVSEGEEKQEEEEEGLDRSSRGAWTSGGLLMNATSSFLGVHSGVGDRHGHGGSNSGQPNNRRDINTGLVPFSLEEVTTIGASETVSTSSSPYRRGNSTAAAAVDDDHDDDGGDEGYSKWSSRAMGPRSHIIPVRNASNLLAASDTYGGPAGSLAVNTTANVTQRAPTPFSSLLATSGVDGANGDAAGSSSSPVPEGSPRGPCDILLCSAMGASRAESTGKYSTAASQLSCSTNYSSSVAVSAPGDAGGELTMAPFGRLFVGGGAGGGGASIGGGGGEWGIGSAGVGRAGSSVLGLSSFRLAVLEARADAAEEQGEFWQGRAIVAEKEKLRLEKVVAEQSAKIAELLERLGEVPNDNNNNNNNKIISSPLSSRSLSLFSTTTAQNASAVAVVEPEPEDQPSQTTSVPGGGTQRSPALRVSDAFRAEEAPNDTAAEEEDETKKEMEDETGEERGDGDDPKTDGDGDEDEAPVGLGIIEDRVGRISFTSFAVGEIAMFFPTPEGNFLAFNVGCPGHFLSKESQALVGRDEHFRPYYILGRIIEIQEVTCEEGNPFKLPCGNSMKIASVETISPDLRAAGLQLDTTSTEV